MNARDKVYVAQDKRLAIKVEDNAFNFGLLTGRYGAQPSITMDQLRQQPCKAEIKQGLNCVWLKAVLLCRLFLPFYNFRQ